MLQTSLPGGVFSLLVSWPGGVVASLLSLRSSYNYFQLMQRGSVVHKHITSPGKDRWRKFFFFRTRRRRKDISTGISSRQCGEDDQAGEVCLLSWERGSIDGEGESIEGDEEGRRMQRERAT